MSIRSSPCISFSTFILLFFLAACSKIVFSYDGTQSAILRPRAPDQSFFSYKPYEGRVYLEEDFAQESDNYRIFHLKIPVEIPIEATVYKSKNRDTSRAVILMPLYGKHELPAKMLAEFLTVYNHLANFHVIYLGEYPGEDPFNLDLLENVDTEDAMIGRAHNWVGLFRKSVIRARRIVDWIEKDGLFKNPSIGITGLSTSSLVASVAMSVDPRIKAAAIVFGGGQIHEIFAYAQESRMKRARERVLASSGISPAELAHKLQPILQPIDPVTYAGYSPSSQILYVDVEYDEFIPQSGREALWQALGKPERVKFLHSHRTAFLSLTPIGLYDTSSKIAEFFKDRL